MNRIEAQDILFSRSPSRVQLSKLVVQDLPRQRFRLNIWRNHAVETVLSLAQPYMAYGRWNADVRLSDYDDTLQFADRDDADLDMLWLDSTRYAGMALSAWLEWLQGRLAALRALSRAPIILATWSREEADAPRLQAMADALPGVFFADLAAACSQYDVALIDTRFATMAGTPIGARAQVLLAQALATRWLPAALLPPIKAVAVDLDNTLHAGILGEDGVDGVRLTPAHKELQQRLKSLRSQGVFLALVSRNESADVEALFQQRIDFPLRWEDFSVTEVSWSDKSAALSRVAAALRIGEDAVLFVDDNPGELLGVHGRLPSLHTALAHADAGQTLRVLDHYPGLWRWKLGDTDAKRVQDLEANSERERVLAEAANVGSYFESLKVTLSFRYGAEDQLKRLADLCIKTNQFNLSLRRLAEPEVAQMMKDVQCCVAGVSLSDSLADSGIIAMIAAAREDRCLVVQELCISCRAMGRQLEDSIVLGALRDMPIFQGCDEVTFEVRRGPRNGPALAWLAGIAHDRAVPEAGRLTVPASIVRDFHFPAGLVHVRDGAAR